MWGIKLSPERGILYLPHGGLPDILVAAGAQRAHSFYLLAFQVRINTLDRDRFGFICLRLEAVYPYHDFFQMVDCLLKVVSRILDFLLHVASLDGA
jgi:hypothetical protein